MRIISKPPQPKREPEKEQRYQCIHCLCVIGFYSKDLEQYTFPRNPHSLKHAGQTSTVLRCPNCHEMNHIIHDYNGWRHREDEDWPDYYNWGANTDEMTQEERDKWYGEPMDYDNEGD